VFEQLQSQLGKLLGKPGEDQQSTITADQLKVVLKSIEGKYNNLKNENKLYKSKIEEQKSTIAELERAVSELKAGAPMKASDAALLTQLEADLNTAQEQLADTQDTIAGLRAEKLQLQSKLSVQEALVSSLRHEISELREGHAGAASPEEHAKALADVDRLKFDNQQLNEKVQDLLGQLLTAEGLKGDVAKKQDEVDSLKQDLAELRTQLEGALQARRQAEVERDGVASRLAPVIDELDTLRDEIDTLKAERDELAEKARAGTTDREALRERAARAEGDLAAVVQDKDELRHQVTRLQGEVEGLQQQLAAGGPQAQVMAELEERVLELKSRWEQAQSENQALQARIQQLIEEPSGLSAREKTEFEFQIKRQADELREATLQIASLREAKVKANLDLEEAAAELVELRRQLDEMRRDRNQFREQAAEGRSKDTEMELLKNQVRELMMHMRGGSAAAATPTEPAPPARPAAEAPRPSTEAAPAPKLSGAEAATQRRREMLNRLIGEKPKQ
jgi:chromosome segregation ATPase